MSLHTFTFGSKLDKFLVRSLFKRDTPNVDDDADFVPPDQKRMEDLANRKPVEVNYGWTWLCRKKSAEQRLLERAGDRMSKELDVLTFIKKQMRTELAYKCTMTPL